MKTPEQVDALMQQLPAQWRRRWCGGEAGPCACLGCVQIGNRALMAEAVLGHPYRGDPEHISEAKIPSETYAGLKITKEEWEAWLSRHPEPFPEEQHQPGGVTIIPEAIPLPAVERLADYNQAYTATFWCPASQLARPHRSAGGPIWAWTFCECGHSNDKHADEHDEVPTGGGRCEVAGCQCQAFKLDPDARIKDVMDQTHLMKDGTTR